MVHSRVFRPLAKMGYRTENPDDTGNCSASCISLPRNERAQEPHFLTNVNQLFLRVRPVNAIWVIVLGYWFRFDLLVTRLDPASFSPIGRQAIGSQAGFQVISEIANFVIDLTVS